MKLYCKRCSWKGDIPELEEGPTATKASCPECKEYIKWLSVAELREINRNTSYPTSLQEALKVCDHPTLLPHTTAFVKKGWSGDISVLVPANMINAHFITVTDYYCPTCNKLIRASKGGEACNKPPSSS